MINVSFFLHIRSIVTKIFDILRIYKIDRFFNHTLDYEIRYKHPFDKYNSK